MRRTTLALAATAASMTLLAGCSSSSSRPSASPSVAPQTLTVFAAASLKAPFTTLGRTFEAAHPGTTVRFSFAGSSDLVTQLEQGAPADVFAAADATSMGEVVEHTLAAGPPVTFASNTLEIAVPPDNPAGVTSFADLSKPGVKLVVCAPQVPCGAAAQRIERATNTTLEPVSEENAVTDVLGKVVSGEADAGLVYVTDVRAAGDEVKGIPFEESTGAVNLYPIATLADSRDADLAGQFVRLVTGGEGQRVLAAAGFARP
jgi:molybdate transport system substrate-binding protein